MLFHSTLFKMDLKFIPLLVLLAAFMGMTVAQASCDPETQYEKEGKCCLKCGPGTWMSSPEDCENPRCELCANDEYQDKYTNGPKCLKQPYCDTNKNFAPQLQQSKTQRSICKCKEGFHCSSKECITCVKHTDCQPGLGAKIIGTDLRDTVCEKCPEGMFNNETSWDAVCRKWTECEPGYGVIESGTDATDNKCALPPRRHVIIITVIAVLFVIVVVILVLLYKGCINQRAKGYFEPRMEEQDMTKDVEALHIPMTPEENEDDPSHELSSEGFTEKGNQVMQERGKEEIVSRQESQLESQEDSQSFSRSFHSQDHFKNNTG